MLKRDEKGNNAATCAAYSFFTVQLAAFLSAAYPNNPAKLSFHVIARYIAYIVIQKWSREADEALNYVLEGLDTKFLRGGEHYKITAW